MNNDPALATEQPRSIRFFISSTFRDMKEEREVLMKRVFPRLRKLCDKRGVTWGSVDLRWGITDEQQAEGKVLPICLKEALECLPFFIGILGERYGWIPPEIPAELIEQEPWLAECKGCSVTELEIRHGVLNNPGKAEHAYFYFRDPAYLESLPDKQQIEFKELPTPEEIGRLGSEEASKRAEIRRGKLVRLKEHIRQSGVAVREGYPGPGQLGDLVFRDLTAVIDRLFPEGEEPDPLDQEAAEHEAFARGRFAIYIGRGEYFNQLDLYISGGGPPLIVVGESGSGKSALLANWAANYRKENPGDFLLLHFVGATAYSSDWAAMLRRILGELKRRYGIQGEIPSEPEKLQQTFANWLHMASVAAEKANEKIILIIDGLNQLAHIDSTLDLNWLPPSIPRNIRLILSVLPGRMLDELMKLGWPRLEVKPLNGAEKKELTRQYLGQYRKTLSDERIERIAASEQTRNPLFLRILLEELRFFGVHDNLDRAIEHNLSSRSVPELYEKILRRLEQDYEREWPGLVEDAMTSIWASKRGLSDDELRDILGARGEPLPWAKWVEFYTAVEKMLISRSGLINLAHNFIREAIISRYLSQENKTEQAHLRIAEYFQTQELNPRKIDELPWQLAEAKSWRRLSNLLADLEFFSKAWEVNRFEVKRYWALIEDSSPLRLVDAYQPEIENPEGFANKDAVMNVASLLIETRHPSEVLELLKYFIGYYTEVGNREKLRDCIGHKAREYFSRGRLDEAISLLNEQEQISRELNDDIGVARALGNQAMIMERRGDLDRAMALHEEEERIWRRIEDPIGLYCCLGNQAVMYKNRGDLDRAMALFREAEVICCRLGDPGGRSRIIGNEAIILKKKGDLGGAIKLLEEQEHICRELGDPDGLQRSLGNQAVVALEEGNLDKAMELLKEQERICRKIGNPEGLSHSLAYQADVLARRGQLKGAQLLAEEAYRLATKHGYASLVGQIRPLLDKIHSQSG